MSQGALAEVIGQAGTGVETLEICRSLSPQIVLLELALPVLSGLETFSGLRELEASPRVIFYTANRNPAMTRAAMELSPDGYVNKHDSLQVLFDAIKAVSAGYRFLALEGTLYHAANSRTPNPEALSQRERRVLALIAESHSSKQIATMLRISSKTVDYYRTKVMEKLDLHDVAALTRFAVSHGLVDAAGGSDR